MGKIFIALKMAFFGNILQAKTSEEICLNNTFFYYNIYYNIARLNEIELMKNNKTPQNVTK